MSSVVLLAKPIELVSCDRALIVRVQAGDPAAKDHLIRQFSPMVFRLISRFFRHREDVEDRAQDVFIKVLVRIDQVRPCENFVGWLARVTINTCYDELRKMRRRKQASQTFGPVEFGEGVVLPAEPKEFGRERQALESLDPKLKIPLVLKEVEELSIKEISGILGITETNVKCRLFRARKKMMANLGDGYKRSGR